MARRPIAPASSRDDAPRVFSIPIETAVRLVTLEDPASGLRTAKDAFCRLKPPEGLTPGIIDSWRFQVAKVAKAVKVLPAPKAADVPSASHRPEHKIGTIREEATKLAAETENLDVIKLVATVLDEVGA